MRSRAQIEKDAASANRTRVQLIVAQAVEQHRQDLRVAEQAQANATWAQRELRGRAGRVRC